MVRAGLAGFGLLAAGAVAWGQVVVPRASVLKEGQVQIFRVEDGTGGVWRWSVLDADAGTMEPELGCFVPAPVEEPRLTRIRADAGDGRRAEGVVLILPHQPFDTVEKVLGRDWLVPYSTDLPFPSLAGEASDGGGRVTSSEYGWNLNPTLMGFGRPATLRWPPRAAGVPQLLSYREGPAEVRRDVTGQSSQTLVLLDRPQSFTIEALLPAAKGQWTSHTSQGRILLRGLVAMAGTLEGQSGHQDGTGAEARFRQPFGVAGVREYPTGAFLVSDPLDHVVRLVEADGTVSTPWGRPGEAGHRDYPPPLLTRVARAFGIGDDGAAAGARFNGPTFLLPADGHCPWVRLWSYCFVADSGNHAIRRIHRTGRVTTFAGMPGQPGHRDGPRATQALFNDPQGLTEDRWGHLYVADRGNQVIRRIDPQGQVTTLAGAPGQRGTADGALAAARFSDLRGLLLHESWFGRLRLFVVDGHAIREVDLHAGTVATVLGSVNGPGFRDGRAGPWGDRSALRQPCLCRPCGLAFWSTFGNTNKELLIADEGNHCLRCWNLEADELTTLAGDPAWGQVGRGQLRDGLPWFPDGEYATLRAPKTLAPATDPMTPRTLAVATGACLAEVQVGGAGCALVRGTATIATPVRRDLPAVVSFNLDLEASVPGDPTPWGQTIDYTLTFLEPDGTVAECHQGQDVSGAHPPLTVEGSFSQAGTGRVRLQAMTAQGASWGWELEVAIEP